MQDGLQERENTTFLRASMGKLRKKTTKEDPKAVEWKDDDGNSHYDLVYGNLVGAIVGVFFKDHPEYGRQWNVKVKAGNDFYSVQMTENSRYGIDFLKKLPNLTQGVRYKFTPWEMETNGKKKGGLAIVRVSDEEKIGSFFQNFLDLGNNQWDIKNINGFPDFTGDREDKDDWKSYYIQVAKFLRNYALKYLQTDWISKAVATEPTRKTDPAVAAESALPQDDAPDYVTPGDSDLPF